MDGTDDDILWNGSEEVWNFVSVRKMKAQTIEDGDSDIDW